MKMPKSNEKVKSKKLKVKSLCKKSKFLIFVCSFAFCLLSFTFACHAQDKIVAVVNNDIVTQKDLTDFLNFSRLQYGNEYNQNELETKLLSMRSDLLNKLIDDRLILQEAKKEEITVDQNRIKARIEDLKRRFASDREFQNALFSQGMVQADIEKKIKEQFLIFAVIEQKIKRKITVKPGEVTDYYEKNKSDFIQPEQREFDSLAIDGEEVARGISQKLKTGSELEELAKENSLELNKFYVQKKGELKKEIEDVIFGLNPKGISEPIKIENKYYIFRLDNLIPPRQQTLSETQDAIHTFLYNEKLQKELAKWLAEIKNRSYIKIL